MISYIGRVLENVFISCSAIPIDCAHLIDNGALFQSLVASPMKEVRVLGSFRFSKVTLLVVLVSSPRILLGLQFRNLVPFFSNYWCGKWRPTSSMFILFLLGLPTKPCYRDIMIHAPYFLLRGKTRRQECLTCDDDRKIISKFK